MTLYMRSSWIAVSACCIFLVFLVFSASRFHDFHLQSGILKTGKTKIDSGWSILKFKAPKENVWRDLSKNEVSDLLDFLYDGKWRNALNLTRDGNATFLNNFILAEEVLLPNKSDVLSFLDNNGDIPARWAKVTVYHGAGFGTSVADYMVGPLPPDERTQVLSLSYPNAGGRNYVHSPLLNVPYMVDLSCGIAADVGDIVADILGEELDCTALTPGANVSPMIKDIYFKDGNINLWMTFAKPSAKSDSWALLKQGLFLKIDLSREDPYRANVLQWLYNGIIYNSTKAFREAWSSPGFEKLPTNDDGEWTSIEDFESNVSKRDVPPPIMVQPAGPRYDLDEEEKFVSWMGFEFYITTSRWTGISLFDIKFQGERLIYELGLQEAMAHYAGDEPVQDGLMWLDTLFGMGKAMFELVPGYDCPIYASYLPITFHEGNTTKTNHNSICIFEYTADHPLQRHTSPSFVSISRNQYLVVRAVSTVGNYDYTIDYTFYLDGSIEVKYRASGFIFSCFWPPKPRSGSGQSEMGPEYGYRIHDAASSSIHDHVLNFKADFDILDTQNTLQQIDLSPFTTSYPYEHHNPKHNTMHLVHEPILAETDLNWPTNARSAYVIANNASRNAWGEIRGYRITPGTGMGSPPHLTIPNSSRLGESAAWSTSDLWVLRQHDNEQRSSHPMDSLCPWDPLVNFTMYADGEDTLQQDLVIWFNLGSHHVPTSSDVPNTLMHIASSSILFTPHNFFDRDVSRERVQGVRLDLGDPEDEGGKMPRGRETRYFGGHYEEGVKLNVDDLEPDLSRYQATEHKVSDLSITNALAGNADLLTSLLETNKDSHSQHRNGKEEERQEAA